MPSHPPCPFLPLHPSPPRARLYLHHSSSYSCCCFRRVVLQGGADEAKAFVEELLQWKAEGVMARVEVEDGKVAA